MAEMKLVVNGEHVKPVPKFKLHEKMTEKEINDLIIAKREEDKKNQGE